MKKIIIIALLSIAVSSCSSLYKSYPIESIPSNNTKTTVFYSIPQFTEVVFEVTYNKTIRHKGIYANKSNLLGLKNVITSDEIKYTVKDIKILTQPKQTPIQQFALVLDGDNIIVEKSKEGTLESITIKDKANKHTYSKDDNLIKRKNEEIKPYHHQNLSPQSLQTQPISEFRLLQRGMLEKVNLTAEEIVIRIEQIREKQIEILSGGLDGTYINTTVDFMYKQLEEMIDGYISLFTGTETVVEETQTYTLAPQKPIISEEDLILQITNTPVPLLARFHTNNQTETLKTRGITYDKTDSSITINMKEKEVSGIKGVYYAIPEMVQVSVETPIKTYSTVVEINQYGMIRAMNTQKQNIIFDTKTGAIKTIK
ncbi:MAG TPA: DUF4831 family protein [Bacteroidales bacterium]|nr:DUF4831 family protein [Bacteroidales bacterium]